MPRPRLHPTDEQRKLVRSLAAIGFKQCQIADMIGIRSTKTLRKYLRAELDRGDLEGYAKVQQTHFQMATDGKHWAATKAWQDSYHRRHGQGPDGAEKREIRRIVWRVHERPKPPAPPQPAALASLQPAEPAPVPFDFLASNEAESPTVITLQAGNAKEKEEEQVDDALD